MNNNINILNLLRADGSIVVNKTLAKNIGLTEAIIYSELVSLFLYWHERDGLVHLPISKDKQTGQVTYTEERYFYCTVENLEENTTIPKKQQMTAIKKLIDLGLINQMNKKLDGATQKRYFTINLDANLILSFLSTPQKKSTQSLDSHGKGQNGTFEKCKMELSKGSKWNLNNTNINNTKTNNTKITTTTFEPYTENQHTDNTNVVSSSNKQTIESNTKLKLTSYQIKQVAKWNDTEKLHRAIEIFNKQDGQFFNLLLKIYNDGAIDNLSNSVEAEAGARQVSSKVEQYNQMDEHNDWDFEEIERLEREYINRKLSSK